VKRLGTLLVCVLLLLIGCSRHKPADLAPQVAQPLQAKATGSQIVEVSGGKQVSGVGAALQDPVVVQVNGVDGNPMAGALVSLHGEGLTLRPSHGVSDASGQLSVAVQLGSAPGNYRIIAETPKTGGGSATVEIREIALGYEETLGRDVNEKYCIRCHDQESTPERVSNFDNLSPAPHAFSDGTFLNHLSDADLIKVITQGGPALGKSPATPAFGSTLSPAQIRAVVAYMRTIADPPYHGVP
jgi:mono/diheme cytochrome c family protein